MSGRSGEYHAVLASATRRQVLDSLLASPDPLDAAAIAERVGLHVTTARFHLDQLAAVGLAHRRTGVERRRGRPRVLYTAARPVREEDAREQLIHVLAGALAREGDGPAESVRAGRRWAVELDSPVPAPAGSTAPDGPGKADGAWRHLLDVLDHLGFAPDEGSDTGVVRLNGCPFRAIAREYPSVVCSVHRGLIEQLLHDAGGDAQLVPFAEPDVCLITRESRHRCSPAN